MAKHGRSRSSRSETRHLAIMPMRQRFCIQCVGVHPQNAAGGGLVTSTAFQHCGDQHGFSLLEKLLVTRRLVFQRVHFSQLAI